MYSGCLPFHFAGVVVSRGRCHVSKSIASVASAWRIFNNEPDLAPPPLPSISPFWRIVHGQGEVGEARGTQKTNNLDTPLLLYPICAAEAAGGGYKNQGRRRKQKRGITKPRKKKKTAKKLAFDVFSSIQKSHGTTVSIVVVVVVVVVVVFLLFLP